MNKKTVLSICIIVLISLTGFLIYYFQNQSWEEYNTVSNDNKQVVNLNFKMLYKYKTKMPLELPEKILVLDKDTTLKEIIEVEEVNLQFFEEINGKTLAKKISQSDTIDLIPKPQFLTKILHGQCQINDLTDNGISESLAKKTITEMQKTNIRWSEILINLKKLYHTAEEKKFYEKFIKKIYY